jgi:hypothetical protein
VTGDDGRLQLVWAGPARGGGPRDQLAGVLDRGVVSPATVLMGQLNDAAAVIKPGGDACLVQPDERQQTGDLRLGGHQPVQEGGQELGIVGEIAVVGPVTGATQVGLVEQQVDDG